MSMNDENSVYSVYYKKITLLNNLKLKVLLLIPLIVNSVSHLVRCSNIACFWLSYCNLELVSRARRSLICISIWLQLHIVTVVTYSLTECTYVRVFSRTAQCSSQHIRYSLISLH